MLNWIWAGLVIVSVLFALFSGNMAGVSNAVFNGAGNAVQLVITLTGVICLWSGIMRIAERAGITRLLSRLLSPLLRLLFPGLDIKGKAAGAICMNMTANLLGLGNAATPLGLTAMRELQKNNLRPDTASNHMVTFVVLNTASLQLIPTTVAAIRGNLGAASPMDILPAVWMASASSLIVALIAARVLQGRKSCV
ncbi:MAG: spore maturation protein A [Clostridiales bacterium]|nr:spore maturation protein A [Clostridiales bacterium]